MSVNGNIMSSQGNNTNLLEELLFYEKTIKPHVKKLRNFELLHELPFYDDINFLRKEWAFKKYPETYEVEIIEHCQTFKIKCFAKIETLGR